MASLVGFMLLDRKNVVADRDIQTPMGQMENAHSHEGQSIVCGGQVVFLGELAIESAQIISALNLLGVPIFLFVEFPASFQLFDQIIPKYRVLNAIQVIPIRPLRLKCAQMVQVYLVFHLFTGKEILIVILSLKVGTDKSNIRWEDPLILNLSPFTANPSAQVTRFVFYQITGVVHCKCSRKSPKNLLN